MRLTCGSIVLMLAAISGETGASAEEKKPPNLDGTYLIVGMEMAGTDLGGVVQKLPEVDRTVVIKGTKFTSMNGGKEETAEVKWDQTKSPPHVTIIDKGRKNPTPTIGIYKLEKDLLTLCFVESDKEADRPTEFKCPKLDVKNLQAVKDAKPVMIVTLKKK